MALPDAYPMRRQESIINAPRGSKCITVVDALAFFYQWGVHPKDHYKPAVNSHRGQEFLMVALMGIAQRTSNDKWTGSWTAENTRKHIIIDDFIIYSATF
jgi:hypothetical protein